MAHVLAKGGTVRSVADAKDPLGRIDRSTPRRVEDGRGGTNDSTTCDSFVREGNVYPTATGDRNALRLIPSVHSVRLHGRRRLAEFEIRCNRKECLLISCRCTLYEARL
jgi:hypothetical protein